MHSTEFEDNQGAIMLVTAPKMMLQSIHTGIKYHSFIRKHVARELSRYNILHQNISGLIFSQWG